MWKDSPVSELCNNEKLSLINLIKERIKKAIEGTNAFIAAII